jgi:hypothetical protein
VSRGSPWAAALLALGVLLCGAPTVAQPRTARDLDHQGRAAFERQEYVAAARAFELAFALAPHAGTKYNTALAWDRADQLGLAADAYALALQMGTLDDERARASQARLTTLTQVLGLVVVSGPIGTSVSVGHASGVAVPAQIHLAPGDHELIVRLSDGTTQRRRVSLRAGSSETVMITPAPPRLPPRSASVPPVATNGSAPTSHPASTSRTAGWVLVGVSGAAAAAAVALGLSFLGTRDEFTDGGRTDADQRDTLVALRALTNVAWGVSAVAAGTGVVLLVTAPGPGSSATPSATPTAPRAPRAAIGVRPLGVTAGVSF